MDKIISVVIPTFNRKTQTDRAVESIAPSRPDLFEIIVVDDCGSAPYSYERPINSSGVSVLTFRSPTNTGPGLARKLGVDKASGSVIAFLDSDDVFEREWPDAILAEVIASGIALRDSLYVAGRAKGGSSLVLDWCVSSLAYLPQFLKRICARLVVIAFNPFYTPATAISKQLCSFSPVERYCEDYFTNAIAILHAERISVLHVVACTLTRSPGSAGGLSEFRRRMWAGELSVRKTLLHDRSIPLVYRALVPLGMLYAAIRNLLKTVFAQSHVPSANPPFPTLEDENLRTVSATPRLAILGTRGIPAQYGGFETFAERLATGLVARGFEVTVFCESEQQRLMDSFHGVKLRYISAPALGPLQTILYDVRSLWMARKGYEVVYMLGYGVAPFCAIPRLWGTDVWINPDGLEWARAKWGPIARLYFRLMEWATTYAPNRVIADCEAIAASLAQRHRRLGAYTVIPYGCEVIDVPPSTEALSQWNLTPGNYYLVVCRLEPENHVFEILEAFQRSSSRKRLVVVGNHLAATKYVAQLRTVQDARIGMIGTVYDQEKLSCLRYHSFAYLHGHSVGGTNPSLLEAMGCGNLIFAHDNQFNRETLRDCGLYFSSVPELTEAIGRADLDNDSLERLRCESRSRARTNYSWSSIISAYVEILEKMQPR